MWRWRATYSPSFRTSWRRDLISPLRKNKSRWRRSILPRRWSFFNSKISIMRKWQRHFRAWTPRDPIEIRINSDIHLILKLEYRNSNSVRSLINLNSMNPCYQISTFEIFSVNLRFISKFSIWVYVFFLFIYFLCVYVYMILYL